jgi:hypothetical protein
MRAAVHTKTPGIRRILAGLGVLVVFGALFVLPLCAALALCTMPCCHHQNAASGSVTSGAMAACETECGIRSAGATPATRAATAPDNGLPKTSPLAVAVAHLPAAPSAPMAGERDAHPSLPGTDTHLHVLHSVFRI